MKKYFFIIISTLVLITTGCGVKCDNAELCIKNNGVDTGYCNFDGGSQYTDTIPPGESVCVHVGYVEVTGSNEQVVWVPLNSSSGNYMVKVADCHVVYTLE